MPGQGQNTVEVTLRNVPNPLTHMELALDKAVKKKEISKNSQVRNGHIYLKLSH